MVGKPKAKNREIRIEKTRMEKKAPKAATKPAVPPAGSGEAPPKPPEAKPPQAPKPAPAVTPEERWRMIADAAYYRAEKRGFVGSDPDEDWLAAETEIDAQLAARKPSEKA